MRNMFIEATNAEQRPVRLQSNQKLLDKNFFVTSDDPDYGTDSQTIVRFLDRIEEMFYGF